jgi:hypothetical protein
MVIPKHQSGELIKASACVPLSRFINGFPQNPPSKSTLWNQAEAQRVGC